LLLCAKVLFVASYDLVLVENEYNEEFYISEKQQQKFNLMSETYKKSLISQLISGKFSVEYIF
jgi:hypothetical protein